MISATCRRTTPALLLLALSAIPSAVRAEASDPKRATRPTAASAHERPAKPVQNPDALVQRLCDALQTLPQTRKVQCCGTSPTGGLAGECARTLGASLRDKALTLDPADVDRCAAESSRQLEGCDWVTPLLPRTPEGCRGILHGRLEARARCRSSLECKDGLFCRGSGPTTPGVCAPPGAPGARCGGAPDTLATYARQTDYDTRHPECAEFCLRGRCAAFLPAGGACSSNKQCAPGSHCASGRCVEGPPPKLGESCEGTACEGDLVCVEGNCSPLKKAGEPCTRPFECEAVCVSPAGAKAGTCGMKCSNWPPAGYTSPLYASPKPPDVKPTPAE